MKDSFVTRPNGNDDNDLDLSGLNRVRMTVSVLLDVSLERGSEWNCQW